MQNRNTSTESNSNVSAGATANPSTASVTASSTKKSVKQRSTTPKPSKSSSPTPSPGQSSSGRIRKAAGSTSRKKKSTLPVTPSPLGQQNTTGEESQGVSGLDSIQDDAQSVASASTAQPTTIAGGTMPKGIPGPGSTIAPSAVQQGEEEEEDDDMDWEDDLTGGGPVPTGPDREAVRALLDTFNEEQLARYEAYRRAHLPKAAVRKLVQSLLGYPVPASVGIILSGCGKLFIGEIVELGLSIMDQQGDSVLTPDHLRAAFTSYKNSHPRTMDSRVYKRVLFG